MNDYMQSIMNSGVAEKATLYKSTSQTLDEWGAIEDEEVESFEFKGVFEVIDLGENEVEQGDLIEGDLRIFVSEHCRLTFDFGDVIEYNGQKYDVDTVEEKTVGTYGRHLEIIAETI